MIALEGCGHNSETIIGVNTSKPSIEAADPEIDPTTPSISEYNCKVIAILSGLKFFGMKRNFGVALLNYSINI